MSIQKTVYKHESSMGVRGLGAYELIDLEWFAYHPFLLPKVIQNSHKLDQGRKWFDLEKKDNKAKFLQIYQMAVLFQCKQEDELEDYYLDLLAKTKAKKRLIEEKKEYSKNEKEILKCEALNLKKRQLRVMEKKYKSYHNQLYPSNPIQILHIQMMMKDNDELVQMNEKGELVVLHNKQNQEGNKQHHHTLEKNQMSSNASNFNPYHQVNHRVIMESGTASSENSSHFSASNKGKKNKPSAPHLEQIEELEGKSEKIYTNENQGKLNWQRLEPLIKISERSENMDSYKLSESSHQQHNYAVNLIPPAQDYKLKQIESKTIMMMDEGKMSKNLKGGLSVEEVQKNIKPTNSYISDDEEEVVEKSIIQPQPKIEKVFIAEDRKVTRQESNVMIQNENQEKKEKIEKQHTNPELSPKKIGTPGKFDNNRFRVKKRPSSSYKEQRDAKVAETPKVSFLNKKRK